MNIFNNSQRKVVCISNDEINFGHKDDASCLSVGEHYTVEHIKVYSWQTLVVLREFPGKRFNSVHFKEEE